MLCQVCDGSTESPEADTEEAAAPSVELFQVRRRSSRNLQLPPLVFRQAEQHDWNSKESETIARPTTLALRTPPVIAITSADAGRWAKRNRLRLFYCRYCFSSLILCWKFISGVVFPNSKLFSIAGSRGSTAIMQYIFNMPNPKVEVSVVVQSHYLPLFTWLLKHRRRLNNAQLYSLAV